MNRSAELVVFAVEERRVALPLQNVERVVRAVEITPLPQGPPVALGVINYRGEIIPVFSLRRRLGATERELEANDQFVIARTARRRVALAVDEVLGVQAGAAVTEAVEILPGLDGLDGVWPREDGLMFIYCLDRFLSLNEEQALATALETTGGAA